MPAGKYNFTIEQGATFRRVITWKDSVGNPVNLTGYTARLEVRAHTADATTIVNLTTANSGITLDAIGNITLYLSAAQTTAITTKAGVYDLVLTDASGYATRLLQGKVKFSPEVSR